MGRLGNNIHSPSVANGKRTPRTACVCHPECDLGNTDGAESGVRFARRKLRIRAVGNAVP